MDTRITVQNKMKKNKKLEQYLLTVLNLYLTLFLFLNKYFN